MSNSIILFVTLPLEWRKRKCYRQPDWCSKHCPFNKEKNEIADCGDQKPVVEPRLAEDIDIKLKVIPEKIEVFFNDFAHKSLFWLGLKVLYRKSKIWKQLKTIPFYPSASLNLYSLNISVSICN